MLLPNPKPRAYPFKQPFDLDKSCVLALMPERCSGTKWHDYSGKGNHGTITGASHTSKGRYGPGLLFDGEDDYVNCGNDNSLDITSAITIEAWVKINIAGIQSIVIKRDTSAGGLIFRIDTYNYLQFLFHNGSNWITSTDNVATFPINDWVHATVTYDKSNVIFYVNGIVTKIVPQTDNIASHLTDDLRIGIQGFNNYAPFNGTIDEVRIYNRALGADEVRNRYELGSLIYYI